ncbi:hypothetical protein RvY_14494 [Ramazzottius varieornatus]|uniref:Uncharacterized protein n=1 Tax=Ramazzottius varieornatus TaxID=947166 RepID=A0A1D1VZY0_RAMVA|nr:hypothetical protein RvY_14494 [Ramazzottius varieornatus]
MSEAACPLLSESRKQTLWEAVGKMVDTYQHHMSQLQRCKLDGNEIGPERSLEDYWKMKALSGQNCETGDADGPQNSRRAARPSATHVEIEYEWISICDKSGREKDHACYLLLPGAKGACFGPRTPLSGPTDERGISRSEMKRIRQSAAEVALMNSIFDTSPSRRITAEFIQEAVEHVSSHQIANGHPYGISSYQLALERMMDKTMMQYQEVCTVLQLLSWSGLMEAMRARSLSQDEPIDYSIEAKIDGAFRSELTMYIMDKENENPGYLNKQLRQAESEMLQLRQAGKDLRFPYEKRMVCLMALDQFQYGGEEELCEFVSNEI